MRRFPLIPMSAAVVLAVSACERTDPAAPADSAEALDDAVAMVAADAALEDLAVMDGMIPLAAPLANGMMGGRGDLVRDRTVIFFDAEGEVMEAYDPELTAAIHTTLTMAGEIVRDHFTATLSRVRDLTVSGLEGSETTRTFDGNGEELHTSTRVSDAHGTRSYRFEATATIDAVVRRPVGATDAPWPLSGTITRHILVTRSTSGSDEARTRERTVVITFDGTQFPTMTIDGVEYEIDLGVGPRDRPARRPGR